VLLVSAGAAGAARDGPVLASEQSPELAGLEAGVRRVYPAFERWVVPQGYQQTFVAEAVDREAAFRHASWLSRRVGSTRREVTWEKPIKRGRSRFSYFLADEVGDHEVTCTFVDMEGRAASLRWSVRVDDARPAAWGRADPVADVGAMVFVKGGTFQMGGPAVVLRLTRNAMPIHEVSVSDFYIGKYMVTTREFCEFLNDVGNPGWRYLMEDTRRKELVSREYEALGERDRRRDAAYYKAVLSKDKCNISLDGETGRYRPRGSLGFVPADYVTWHGAVAYCEWLSRRTGRRYRLPTEAEWEYAARGPEGRRYPWGEEEPVPGRHNFGPGRQMEFGVSGKQRPPRNVGSFPVADTPLGVSDMAGLLWQWCSDVYSETYYAVSPRENPQGPALPANVSGDAVPRVLRGVAEGSEWTGLWSTFWVFPAWCRQGQSANLVLPSRHPGGPTAGHDIGFRIVMEPPEPSQQSQTTSP
jgi:formylglycine-generating enzyme required for sulfatase activity